LSLKSAFEYFEGFFYEWVIKEVLQGINRNCWSGHFDHRSRRWRRFLANFLGDLGLELIIEFENDAQRFS
jgi:hypothetical protein